MSDGTEQVETKVLTSVESSALVHQTARSVYELINKNIANVDAGQRWLIVSRVISFMFANHYKVSMKLGIKETDL